MVAACPRLPPGCLLQPESLEFGLPAPVVIAVAAVGWQQLRQQRRLLGGGIGGYPAGRGLLAELRGGDAGGANAVLAEHVLHPGPLARREALQRP